jgi:hypothetical protein
MNTQIETYAHRAATRRALIFELPAHPSASDRQAEAAQVRKLLQDAACGAVRAGKPDVANTILNAIAGIESAQP